MDQLAVMSVSILNIRLLSGGKTTVQEGPENVGERLATTEGLARRDKLWVG